MWISKRKWNALVKRVSELEKKSTAYCYEMNAEVTLQDYVRFVPKFVRKEAITRNNG